MSTQQIGSVPLLTSLLLIASWQPASAQAPVSSEPEKAKRGPGTERDRDCLVCHAGIGEERAPKIDLDQYGASSHSAEGCVGCHEDVLNPSLKHEEQDEDVIAVRCASCHEGVAKIYGDSVHGRAPRDPEREQATCARCHGSHEIVSPKKVESKVHPINQKVTCGKCHGADRIVAGHKLDMGHEFKAVLRGADEEGVAALMEKKALVSAGCADCHSSHGVVEKPNPSSEIHPTRIVATCRPCHEKEAASFRKSAHGAAVEKPGFEWNLDDQGNVVHPSNGKEAPVQPPVCSTCHLMHVVPTAKGGRGAAEPHSRAFRLDIVKECGTCHRRLMETYPETYHGKATLLGDASAAKCSDCHTAHDNLPASDPASTVSEANRPETCRKCHEGASDGFAAFWPHADHKDHEKYPVLFWVFAFMTTLLISVFTFFGAHTIMWVVREHLDAKRAPKPHAHPAGPLVSRFSTADRLTHLAVIISFLGLAATGAPLKFAHTAWARIVFDFIGGVHVAGTIHRAFGAVTFAYFSVHLVVLATRLIPLARKGTLISTLIGPESLVPRLSDLFDIIAQMKYFVGLGPKPTWDRWTYWEKFDYWAVFWGVAIIGTSGLMLWFPVVSTRVLPGWVLNIALVIHSDEALLAMGFIFGVHFFNSHLRRSKFPMDPVIFTGSIPEHEFKEERGRQWERLQKGTGGELRRVEPPSARFMWLARIFGISAWIFGLILLGFIVHGFFF
ncbi:MAG: hypothetical protein HY791_30040 [Deltaproteobacteria bacterium]|nr:hypothetical protein [Deltaproteobacteria bacterium]